MHRQFDTEEESGALEHAEHAEPRMRIRTNAIKHPPRSTKKERMTQIHHQTKSNVPPPLNKQRWIPAHQIRRRLGGSENAVLYE